MKRESNPVRIFADGKPLALASDCKMEIGEEIEVTGKNPMFSDVNFEATATIDVTDKQQADDFRKLMERLTISRRERKKMLHAVTHGQAIMFVGNIAIDGGEPTQIPVCIDRPSVLRKFFRAFRGARFQYAIVPLNCCDKYPRLNL
jgi:hypothetical protein